MVREFQHYQYLSHLSCLHAADVGIACRSQDTLRRCLLELPGYPRADLWYGGRWRGSGKAYPFTAPQALPCKRFLGEKVYSVDQDIAAIIKDNDIEGILVSPSRVKDFRNNQALQDKILGAGAKIFMAEGAKEVNLDEDLNDDYLGNLKMREVSVEELLPRNEIRVDLKSVEELLKGTRVLITGSAGSIGSEMVRQVAAFKPAKMMLIDQAESSVRSGLTTCSMLLPTSMCR